MITGWHRVVIKVGSSLVCPAGGPVPDEAFLQGLSADIAGLRGKGITCLIVSSGAVAVGRRHLSVPARNTTLDVKQACAAVGQPILWQAWAAALGRHHIMAAQSLLTLEDTETRRRWLNARATLQRLFGMGVCPVLNENDTVATAEIRYGDNDRLAARVAQLIRADHLILLSDTDGLYTADPRIHAGADHIPHLEGVSDTHLAMATGPASLSARGGMRTKLEAARIAATAGCTTLIASGQVERPVRALIEGARHTRIAAQRDPMQARKAWIAGQLHPKGCLVVDDGAARALLDGASLLPSGVQAVSGAFEKGDAVDITTQGAAPFARGIIAYDQGEAARLMGAKSGEIETRLGYAGAVSLVHRDDLVILRSAHTDSAGMEAFLP